MNITLQTLEPVAFFNEWKVLNAVVRDKFHRPVWFKTYAVPEYEDDYLLGYEIRTYGDFDTASVFTHNMRCSTLVELLGLGILYKCVEQHVEYAVRQLMEIDDVNNKCRALLTEG